MAQGKKKLTKEMVKQKANKARKERAYKKVTPLSATKFIRDPIHDLIRIDTKVVLDILDTPPMQRLKRIKQLGLANLVYPSAEHTRFGHSLGAYHISRRMLNQFSRTGSHKVLPYDQLVVQLAALMHDIGHGPFSHMFERVIKQVIPKHAQKHHHWSVDIIKGDASIKSILGSIDGKLGSDICDIIINVYKPDFLSSIVSSQVDVDRFDYMLRDSYMTGVHYGRFDLNWMLRNLTIENAILRDEDNNELKTTTIVVDAKRGLSSLEDYLLGLFNLYKHVYFHRTVRVAEAMMEKTLYRAFTVAKGDTVYGVKHQIFKCVNKNKKIPLSVYLSLDDNTIMSWLSNWATMKTGDKVLRDLSTRLYERNLFKAFDLTDLSKERTGSVVEDIKGVLRRKRLDDKYYLVFSEPSRDAYSTFLDLLKKGKQKEEIYYKDEGGQVLQYSSIKPNLSRLGSALRELSFKDDIVCVPRSVAEEVEGILKEARG